MRPSRSPSRESTPQPLRPRPRSPRRPTSPRQAAAFGMPAGITVKLFAAEPDVANPVAFAIDEQGRVFVCETFRQNRGVS
jgi:quinoprotein glucose dehydrogenase